MKKWKIKYLKNGNIMVAEVKANTEQEARFLFYMSTMCDDIEEITEI